jgi:hypothetical protein
MADFENELSGMFQAAIDPAVGPALAEAALARIARQDHRRRLALTLAGAVGVLTAGAIAGASGATQAARELAGQALAMTTMHVSLLQVVWPMAALAIAVCAVQALRTTRAL